MMHKLIAGYQQFRAEVFPRKQGLYAKLADGQSPPFLLITCSDSRVLPQEFTGAGVGDIFEDRCLGNIIPEPGCGENETDAVIEFAMAELGVEHVIVCGHTRCAAMNALLNPEAVERLPAVRAWLRNADETLEVVREKYPDLRGGALLDATVRENVLVQLGRLRRMPCVAPRVAAGTLSLHGWVFEIEHGRVVEYDPRVGRFVVLPWAYKPSSY
jgi:carbonic anhydrase